MKESLSEGLPATLSKHDLVLLLIGLALENREVGEEYSINNIAKDVKLHHQTVKNVLKHIYYAQNFIPRIDLIFKERGRIYVRIEDLPAYQTYCVDPKDLVLLRLFNREAWFGKKISYEIIWPNQRGLLSLLSKLKQQGLIEVEYDSGMIGLSREGADEAFEIIEDLSRIRDSAIKNIENGSEMLRERKRICGKVETIVQAIVNHCDELEWWTREKISREENKLNLSYELKRLESIIKRLESIIREGQLIIDRETHVDRVVPGVTI